MKSFQSVSLSLALLLGLTISGCHRREKIDATKPLEQSFQQSEPEVKQTIQAVNSQLKSGNYRDALQNLTPVVSNRELSQAQKQAIGAALKQVENAAAADPKLNTPEMYQLRLKMVRALHEKR